jgi:cbb3-type cytochrome oxidase subunit 3
VKQQILTQFPWMGLSSLALVIFFSFFVALLVITNLKPQKKIQERASQLPLEEGEKESHHVRA